MIGAKYVQWKSRAIPSIAGLVRRVNNIYFWKHSTVVTGLDWLVYYLGIIIMHSVNNSVNNIDKMTHKKDANANSGYQNLAHINFFH